MLIVIAAAFKYFVILCHQRDTLVSSSIWKISCINFFVSFVMGSIFCKIIWFVGCLFLLWVCLFACLFFGWLFFFYFQSSQLLRFLCSWNQVILLQHACMCWFEWKFLCACLSICWMPRDDHNSVKLYHPFVISQVLWWCSALITIINPGCSGCFCIVWNLLTPPIVMGETLHKIKKVPRCSIAFMYRT